MMRVMETWICLIKLYTFDSELSANPPAENASRALLIFPPYSLSLKVNILSRVLVVAPPFPPFLSPR